MGTPMAGRVRSAGHDLIVWNRTPERAQALVARDRLPDARDTALDALAAGPFPASVNRIKSTSSDFIITLAAKDLTLATDAADLPQLAAARDWLRTAAAEGAEDTDLRNVVAHIHPGRPGAATPLTE
jgi:3-hydroxyisobutyrate dehydrogenase-like beta-hydroxyacid dehydrogenase